ncbi:alpha/beta hydrolase family protein [Breoghania corrubedonensis]|nr:alpha/beta hydrolase family protein [Breoghania corrubedonensis]
METMTVAPAEPVVFDGLAGSFHAARGDTAILLLSPWGYEELCSRKSYRILGETLAARGYPTLRFDYPGTGNSAGESAGIEDERSWRDAVRRAFDEVGKLCTPSRVIVIGQGVGGALAADLASETDVAGLVLLAPVAQGRGYLRELTAWTAMTKPTFLVDASDGPQGGLMAGGSVLSAATASEIRSLNILKAPAPRVSKVLLVERDHHPGDAKLAANLLEKSVAVDRLPFEGYVDYVSNPTLSIVPVTTIEAVTSWIATQFPASATASAPTQGALPSTLQEADYEQTLVRFGANGMFFGVFTRALARPNETAFLFLNSGYDHSVGWGRSTVDFARALASSGVTSLRMDAAGIGESRLWPGQAPQVLYGDRQLDDVKTALDWLTGTAGVEKVVLVGRCSGAYLALIAAEADPRVTGLVAINVRRLVWDPDEDVETTLREPIQTLDTYRRKMVDKRMLKRLLTGDLPLSRVVTRLASAVSRVLDRKLAPVLRGASRHYRLNRIVQSRFKALRERGVPVSLIFCEGDRGVQDVQAWFKEDFSGLAPYENVELSMIANADHNLTPLASRAEVLELLRGFASSQRLRARK